MAPSHDAPTRNAYRLLIDYPGPRSQQPVAGHPTYKGLASLVRLCPCLQNITIKLAISEETHSVAAFLGRADTPVSPVSLDFQGSIVHDLDTMALWAAKIFPKYSVIARGQLGYDPVPRADRWVRLAELVDQHKIA